MIRIETEHHPYFPKVWHLLETAFHAGERRDLETLKTILKDGQAQVWACEEQNRFMGMAVLWTFENFNFLEYLAVHPDGRGKGIGSAIMQTFLSEQLLLLEVQPPTDAINKSRIAFYERLGLRLNPYPYHQPPYQKRGETFPLQIMSSPQLLSPKEFDTYTTLIRKEVYEKWYTP